MSQKEDPIAEEHAKQLSELVSTLPTRAEHDHYRVMQLEKENAELRAQLAAAPAQGWRLLSEGEVIQEGDEYYDRLECVWRAAKYSAGDKCEIGKHFNPIRRRVSLAAQGEGETHE